MGKKWSIIVGIATIVSALVTVLTYVESRYSDDHSSAGRKGESHQTTSVTTTVDPQTSTLTPRNLLAPPVRNESPKKPRNPLSDHRPVSELSLDGEKSPPNLTSFAGLL